METGNRDKPTFGAALIGSWVGIIVLTVIDLHLPYLVGWLLNTVVILGVCFAICAYKRSRASWACFWVLAALCALAPVLSLAGLTSGDWTAADWIIAVIEVTAWYWLLRFPAVRPVAAPAPGHVVVHHVMHGTLGDQAATATGQVLRDAVPDYLVRGAVPGAVEQVPVRRAISAPATPLAKLVEAARSRVRR